MSAESRSDAPIRRFVTVLRRRIWLLVAFLVFVPAAAVGYSLNQSRLYQASSTVLISRQSVANQLSGSTDVGLQQQSFQQVLVTQSRLARTPDVLRATLKSAGNAGRGLSVDDLRADSTVEANPDSDLLTFDVVRPDVGGAKRLAVSYANAYVQYRRTLDSASLERALGDVNATLAVAAKQRSAARDSLVARLTTSRQQLETLLALQTANAQVVAEPDGVTQVRPRPLRNGLLALFIGLVLGLAAVFLRDALDTRVRTSAEAEALLATPILSRIPSPQPGKRDESQSLALLQASGGVGGEGFRILRSNLSFGLLSSDAKVLMVTSSSQAEGKSTTIANLAVAYALGGKRVVIVDLDLRRPSLARLFGEAGGAGVAGIALGLASMAEALRPISLDRPAGSAARDPRAHLDLLNTGALPPDPSEFINTNAVRNIVQELREQYDLVLIDAPPLLHVSDTSVIADIADGVFLCVRLGFVHRAMLTELRTALDRLTIPVLGQVITGAETDDLPGYQGYYVYAVPTEQKPTKRRRPSRAGLKPAD